MDHPPNSRMPFPPLVGERTLFNCCQVHLNPESICSLAHFSDFSFWQSRVQTVATAMNATGRVQITPHRTHTRALLLAAHTTCDSHVWLKVLTIHCVFRKVISSLVMSFFECSFDLVSSCLLTVHNHTDATDWNQTEPVCDSALGWTVWPSGRSDSKHRL